jgi:hypothetical protein
MTLVLRTERPVLLDREKSTHEWWLANDPAKEFGFEVVYDREPGDWRHYARSFKAIWRRASAENRDLINCESDVVPTMEAFQSVLSCDRHLCVCPNELWDYGGGKRIAGYSAWVENRVRGGWESHFVQPGEEFAKNGDLGFVRFSAQLVSALNIDEVPDLETDASLLNERLFTWIGRRTADPCPIHLHWLSTGTGLHNSHTQWDAGDDAHWGGKPPQRQQA